MIAIFGGLAAFGVFGGFSGIGRSGASDPYEAIPRASFIAATIDFAELRRSPLFDVAVGKDTSPGDPMRRALGVGALQEACGFDPVSRIQKVAIAVPEEGERGEFGVVARVEVTRDELERCTKALAEKRGGAPRPTRSERSWSSRTGRSAPAARASRTAEAASSSSARAPGSMPCSAPPIT